MADSNQLSEIVNNLLNSDSFRRSINNALINELRSSDPSSPASSILNSARNSVVCTTSERSIQSQPLSTSATVVQNQISTPIRIQQEISRLFRPNNQLRTSKSKSKPHSMFSKEFILLDDPNECKTLSGRSYSKTSLKGRTLLTKIDKNWNYKEICCHVSSIFKNILVGDTDFELLLPCYRELVKPELKLNGELTGENLHKLFGYKPVYVRPSRTLSMNDTYGQCQDINPLNELETSFERQLHPQDVSQNTSNSSFPDLNNDINNNMNDNSIEYFMDIEEKQFENDIKLAIENSLEEEKLKTIDQLLKQHIQKHELDRSITFNVYRADIWSCTLRSMKRPSFNPFCKPYIIFTDIDNTSEGAIDAGGERREFFRLAMDYLQNSPVFEGTFNLILYFILSLCLRLVYPEIRI